MTAHRCSREEHERQAQEKYEPSLIMIISIINSDGRVDKYYYLPFYSYDIEMQRAIERFEEAKRQRFASVQAFATALEKASQVEANASLDSVGPRFAMEAHLTNLFERDTEELDQELGQNLSHEAEGRPPPAYFS
jgi:hypothetical protein